MIVNGHREPVQVGIRVSAEIKTGDRKVIDYLLSPVMQAVKEAGRERWAKSASPHTAVPASKA